MHPGQRVPLGTRRATCLFEAFVRRVLPVLSILLACSGCAATVTPGEIPGHVAPRSVFLLDHGRHPSLALSRDDGSLVRYVYGDWRWYAKRETGFFRIFPTLFAETQAALGRRILPGPPEAEVIRRQLRVEVKRIHPITAPAGLVDHLLTDLETRFDSARDTLIYNPVYDLEFVHHSRPYRLSYNSNHAAADWLEELGMEVRGHPTIGFWRVHR